MSDKTCQFVTFYSYKGGTGRSMLLANVAWLLACNGERVLIIDWDLEAPGIHRYLHPFLADKSLSSTEGLIDALGHFVDAAVSGPAVESSESEPVADDPDWYKMYANLASYAVPLKWPLFPGAGKLDLVGAGQQGPMYGTKVNLFDWRQFYVDFAGAAFLQAAKEILKDKYDYVLIDSRTGVSDTSGICTTEMPDTLVVCFTFNNQNIEGAHSVASGAIAKRGATNKLSVIPVPTRVDNSESERLDLARELARTRFQALVPLDKYPAVDGTEKQLQQYWGDVEVPYIPKYAYEEVLACFSDVPHLKSSVLSSAEKVASLLRGQATEMIAISDEVRSGVLKQFARKPYLIVQAEDYVARLRENELQRLRRVLLRLVQVAPVRAASTVDVPCACPLSDFSDDAERALLHQAKAQNIVLFGRDANKVETVTLADERLIQGWPRLAAWIDADRDFLAWLPQLTLARKTWVGSDKNLDDLLTGTSRWKLRAG